MKKAHKRNRIFSFSCGKMKMMLRLTAALLVAFQLSVSASAFAQTKGVTYADLKRFNPWLRDRKLVTGGRTYTICVPRPSEMFYERPNTWVHDPAWVVGD